MHLDWLQLPWQQHRYLPFCTIFSGGGAVERFPPGCSAGCHHKWAVGRVWTRGHRRRGCVEDYGRQALLPARRLTAYAELITGMTKSEGLINIPYHWAGKGWKGYRIGHILVQLWRSGRADQSINMMKWVNKTGISLMTINTSLRSNIHLIA